MPTKAYQRFLHRIESYAEDLELCDLLVSGFKIIADSAVTISQALGSNQAAHPTLARHPNNRNSRGICGNHLRRSLHVAFIKDLHEDFSAFLAESMMKAAQQGVDPGRFVGDAKLDFHAKDILGAGGWDQTVRLISDSIFRKLENERNTKLLIEKVITRLGLQIDLALLTAAMPYLDARHMLVHQDAKADAAYIRDYPGIILREGKIVVDAAFVASAKSTITALASDIDTKVIAAGLVRRQDMRGQR